MPFGLTIGTERAGFLQQAIQDELITRGYSQEADPVMAEYITIMIINNKTAAQITGELEDLIGSDFDSSFTDWLFVEAMKGSSDSETTTSPASEQPAEQPAAETPSQASTSRQHATRNGVYQQAISQALPQAQKRTASARSPSPSHPNKIRRTDVPTGPRAMQRDGPSNPRSLLDRVGGPSHNPRHNQQDEIQARIDNITNGPGAPNPNMMIQNGFPMGVDMNMAMGNPIMLQDIMMNQMALMAQFTGMMGGGMNGGFPMMPGDMAMMPQQNVGPNGFQGAQGAPQRGRGGGRGSRGIGRGKGGPSTSTTHADVSSQPITEAPPTTGPAPTIVSPAPLSAASTQRPTQPVPERPQSPTLCKYALKCTNAHCRWSHPSPVATAESGVVLSNDPCENGKNCKDKDCIKAHVSPAVLKPHVEHAPPPPSNPPHQTPPNTVACRFGAACTRPNCTFSHPPRPATTPCRFGAGCTRAGCSYQHPEGRVLPNTFHRGLSASSPVVSVKPPETGTIGATSHHKSVTFKNPSVPGQTLQEKLKELEKRKLEAENKVKEAEAAAANKDNKPVAIAA